MAETLDTDLLKDLRGMGKPPSFDGNDSEYQDFRFSFRIHMSLVSPVSHTLMDKCDVERNPISPNSSESASRCTCEMLRTDVLFTGLDKERQCPNSHPIRQDMSQTRWRLIHSRYAPDTQNRQYALMQKIMMPAKLLCDHAQGFESGLSTWELDVGESERASGTALTGAVKYTVMMNMAPIVLRNSLELGTYSNSAALRAALLRWCYSSRNFGANPTVTAGNVTSADDDRTQVDSLKKVKGERKKQIPTTRKETVRLARPTRVLQISTRARTSLLTQLHSQLPQCRILRKHQVPLENSRAFQTWNRGSWV